MTAGGPRSASLWRLVALALLLCAAFDVLAIDTGLWRPSGPDSCCGCPSEQDCFCCCRHVVVADSPVFDPLVAVATLADRQAPGPVSVPPPIPFHPPRA